MTMPLGSAEEPQIMVSEHAVAPVHVVSSDAKPGKNIAPEFARFKTFVVSNAVGPYSSTPGAQRILNRSLRRHEARILVNSGGSVTVNNPVPGQPAVPASTVAVQNTNAYPVNVVISGGTLTAVFVNGVQVGTGDGTYLVPSGGAISITYSVAPTWVWSNANGLTSTQAQSATDGCVVGSPAEIAAGNPATLGVLGGYLQINDNVTYKGQNELWVAYPASNGGPVYVTVLDMQYASDPDAWREDQ